MCIRDRYRQWVQYLAQFDVQDDTNAIPFSEIEKIATVEDYLDVQLVYVFCKYCFSERNEFLHKILNEIDESNALFEYPNSRHHQNQTEEYLLIRAIRELNGTIIKEETGKKESYSYAIDHVLRLSASTMQLEKRRWIAVAGAIKIHFQYSGVRLLRVLDGVDNVHINNDASRHYYNHMIREIFEFSKRKPADGDVHFVAMRRRTFIDLMRYPMTQQTGGYVEHQEIEQSEPKFSEILEKRVEVVSKKLGASESIYAEILEEVIKGLPADIEGQHHCNVREFLHNKSTLALLVYYRMLQISAKGFNIQSHISILEERNLFLNGRLFLRSRRDWEEMNSEMGVCFFNIFFYRESLFPCTTIENWYGLCGVRILQLLEAQKTIKLVDLTSYLETVIEYPNGLVEWNIDRLRAFGMADTEDPSAKGELYLRISDKGRYFLQQTFGNIDFLYFFALDTLLPVGLVDEGLIAVHDNKFYGASSFPSAAITTVTTFILFLLSVNKLENDILKKNKENSLVVKMQKLTLPVQIRQKRQTVISDIGALLSACDDKEIGAVERYITELKTII